MSRLRAITCEESWWPVEEAGVLHSRDCNYHVCIKRGTLGLGPSRVWERLRVNASHVGLAVREQTRLGESTAREILTKTSFCLTVFASFTRARWLTTFLGKYSLLLALSAHSRSFSSSYLITHSCKSPAALLITSHLTSPFPPPQTKFLVILHCVHSVSLSATTASFHSLIGLLVSTSTILPPIHNAPPQQANKSPIANPIFISISACLFFTSLVGVSA